ncbi:MAG: exo-alpha-sialidase, partial [Pirellulales bacterium]
LRKGAHAWSRPFLMADTPELPDCNPVLFIDAKQRLWLFWVAVRANRWERSLLKYRRADDYLGEAAPKWNWQDVIILKPGDAFPETLERGFRELHADDVLWAEYAPSFAQQVVDAARDPVKRQTGWMTRIHPLQLPSGRLLLPLYSDGFVQCLMAISDDAGATWRASHPITGLGASQPSLVRRRNGTLVAFLRDDGGAPGRVQMSVSSDEGMTWSVARETELPNPGASVEAIALADGQWLIVYNSEVRGRHRLAVSLSNDEGRTWSRARLLEDGQPGREGFSYPSVIQTPDGRVHVTYSYSTAAGESIKHVAFDVDWVAGAD